MKHGLENHEVEDIINEVDGQRWGVRIFTPPCEVIAN